MIALEDLKGMSEIEVKVHIAAEYGGDKSGFDYGSPTRADQEKLIAELEQYEFLLAYESVGSWGCDSSSFFLMRTPDGKLWENHASHCSCYGFEGQWSPEETTKEALERRSYWPLGGYDSDNEGNKASMRLAVAALP